MAEATGLLEQTADLIEKSGGSYSGLFENFERISKKEGKKELSELLFRLASYSYRVRMEQIEGAPRHREETRISGAIINKEVFEGAIKVAQNRKGATGVRDYIEEFSYCYHLLVSLPNVFLSERIPLSEADHYFEIISNQLLQKDDQSLASKKVPEKLKSLNKIALEETAGIVKGINGEVYCFFLFRRLGFDIRRSSIEEDMADADFFLKADSNYEFPIQVKTSSRSADEGIFNIRFSPGRRETVVGINPAKIEHVPGLLDELTVWNIPRTNGIVIIPKELSVLNQINQEIHDVIKVL